MATVVDDPNLFIIDEAYEFSAPKYYNFIDEETEEDTRKAEHWFQITSSYAPSPFMPRIKTGRTVQLESLCDFTDAEELQDNTRHAVELTSSENKEEVTPNLIRPEHGTSLPDPESKEMQSTVRETCTPQPPTISSQKNGSRNTDSKRQQSAKKIASILRNPSELKSKTQSQQSHGSKRQSIMKSSVGTPNFSQENQAIKRQKLKEGKSRKILDIKLQHLPHKTRLGVANNSCSNLSSSAAKAQKGERKMYVRQRQPVAPFVSTAEMMMKFQSSTRKMSLSCISNSTQDNPTESAWRKPQLTITRPKEPKFKTAQRVRPTTVKSSAELEEEMMAKLPQFKARPVNKKIMKAPTQAALPKSIPQLPEFKEFRLETMARANKNADTTSVQSIESSQNHQWQPHITAPKSPVLITALRARPPKIKSTEELEKDELEKAPNFKARPLNRKIFESKGALGVFCNTRKQVTVPQEFHFATDERIPPTPTNFDDLFDKLSLNSESQNDKTIPRNTIPNPFHLYTEERGVEKERKLFTEVLQKQMEEERSRNPKATPYPCTTDYPVIPPKPEPKPCTKPEPFELESLVRHEQEMRREVEEKQRLEEEEAKMRLFKARPVLIEDPIPVPEKERKPLTEVQEFNLHADHRAADKAEFDKKIEEKEIMHKRYREEAENARMMEEEKALKQLRRSLVHHATPMPNFDHPFIPQSKSSKQVTRSSSPELQFIKRRKEMRKTVCPYVAAASQMR
ncbi:protein TPX2-like [Nicotiana tabacum]|uniref:Protein TPX2-like n=1 Tax=Nicotiana tabacum TaxID=4097 RepID=A0A1S4DKX0_TOBAC|nr:PREDICTED: protein TPX2-like [Nicotiana tabacum]